MKSFASKGKPKKGLYKPTNPDKYIQPSDKTMNKAEFPEYRSSWELKFYRFCDISSSVKLWSTEYMAIPYIDPNDQKQHRYFPDVFVVFNNDKKVMIEIKPYKEVYIQENKRVTEKMTKTYLKNQAKWEACNQFCKNKGWKFQIMTEYDLGIRKSK